MQTPIQPPRNRKEPARRQALSKGEKMEGLL